MKRFLSEVVHRGLASLDTPDAWIIQHDVVDHDTRFRKQHNYAKVTQLRGSADTTCASGGMVDTLVSGTSARKGVEVRLLSRAPGNNTWLTMA